MANCALLLDNLYNDLVLGADGDIAVAQAPYATALDCACSMRLFKGELWFDTAQGIDYFGQDLGQFPPLALVRQQLVDAAMTVPDAASAACFFTGFENRRLQGQVQVKGADGQTSVASF